jgi:hypothetical protein
VPDDEMMRRRPLDRGVRWLCRRGSVPLVGISLLWFVGWTALVYLLLDWLVADVHQQGLADISAPLMTAFGALFAFLTAFVITIEWNQHRDVEQIVGQEADACVRLIWASASPGCDSPRTRALLLRYLQSVRYEEWPTLAAGGEGCRTTQGLMIELQREVRAMATRPDVPGLAASELVQSADAMAATRADRVNAAGHDLMTPLFVLAFVSGVMLTLNSVALSLHLERGYAIVIGGLVILIAMDLALLVALASPFAGALRVHGRSLARVLDDLEAGDYGELGEGSVAGRGPARPQ